MQKKATQPDIGPRAEIIPRTVIMHFMGKRLGGFSNAVFTLTGEQRIFQQMRSTKKASTHFGYAQVVKTEPLPKEVSLQVQGDVGPFWTKEDEFGQPLMMATAGSLKRVVTAGIDNLSHDFLAFFAYVRELPDDGIFVLYWAH